MSEAVLKIEKMAFGGAGFGHLNGKACFVPFTAPGDSVRIRITKEKRSYLEGEMVELLEPSERRITPPCPVFGTCGGCNWQYLSYTDQLAEKEEIFAELLWRSGRVERDRIEAIAPAPEPFGYRSRIQLKVRCSGNEPQIGFYRAVSHSVVNIPEKCAVAHPLLNRLISSLRSVLAAFPETEKMPQIDAAVGDDGRTELVIHYIGNAAEEINRHFGKSRHSLGADAIFLQTGRKKTLQKIAGGDSPALSYMVPSPSSTDPAGYRLEFSNGGFSQVNYQQNLTLIGIVISWAGLTGRERVLDIYCGNGNFSLPLAENAAHVLGVEDYRPSITCARRNCAAYDVKNISFQCKDAVSAIKRLVSADDKFDLVFLDPPRTGAAEVVRMIPALQPRAIIYVSCDPATLARDIGTLKKSGYEVIKSRPVDMFPQTYHIESVTLLEYLNKSGEK
ncbi:MAG TPA: class I SAM-dependent RNA methyltransferase [Geobacteraceae bacterium]|nr:class I SAM-dependent RNA methyltransferase [Geobacteraceae bacterium]